MSRERTRGRKSVLVPVQESEFSLPHSISPSEVNFPVLMIQKRKASWKKIESKSDKFKEWLKEVTLVQKPESCFKQTEVVYIMDEVIKLLIPAIEETLKKAKIWNVLKTQKSFFNGIDHIAQYLWNNNPRHLYRKKNNLHIFNMPWVREELVCHPRKIYPRSWLWPREYAAVRIQKYVRGHFVRSKPEVAEMRTFWKKFELQKNHPSFDANPLFLKQFAMS